MTRRSVRRVLPALGALAVAGTLAACGGGQPGAAAVVDGRAIPGSDLDDAAREFGDLVGYPRVVVLGALIDQPVVHALAEQNGVALSDEQVEDALREVREQSGADPDAELSDAAVRAARWALEYAVLSQSLGEQEVTAAIADASADRDVTVNPRYGEVVEGGALGSPPAYPWVVAAAAPAP